MTECRDWLNTLWRVSFKGVPFWFESDKEEGGRGLVIHEFPNSDEPYVEDLGEAPRFYSGAAYVHGDDADSLANALKAVLASRGAGTLVTPLFGPVTVHCQTFERETQRDRLGYVAFQVKFVRKGLDVAFVSVPLLQNNAYVAAENVARLLGEVFPRVISIDGEQDTAARAVADTLASAAVTLDVQHRAYPVAPDVSAKLRDAIALYVADVPDQVASGDAGAAIVALTNISRDLADALPAMAAVRASLELASAFAAPDAMSAATIAGRSPAAASPPSVPAIARGTPAAILAADNEVAASRFVRLAALTAYAEGTLRRTFAARPDGVTARAEVAERFEAESLQTSGAADAALFVAIEALRGSVIEWLTRTINDLAPVIVVETAAIRPSLDLAWTLYADPSRAAELVARNGVRHPSFMPREIAALSR